MQFDILTDTIKERLDRQKEHKGQQGNVYCRAPSSSWSRRPPEVTSMTPTPEPERRPPIDEDGAKEVALRLFGLAPADGTAVKMLPSYDDKNFYIQAPSAASGAAGMAFPKEGCVLKVTNLSTPLDVIRGQNELMLHLKSKGVPVPYPLPNLQGEFLSLMDVEGGVVGKKRIVRLLAFTPGETLAKVCSSTARLQPDLLHQVGGFVGKFHNALEGFRNAALENNDFLWMLGNAYGVTDYLSAVDDEADRDMCARILEAFKSSVLDRLDSFKSGIIHGDFNEQNLVAQVLPKVSRGDPGEVRVQVSGILDFGDCHKAPIVFDLAMNIMYMMIVAVGQTHQLDVLDTGAHVLAGYSSVRSISPEERSVLKVCIAARFVQSMVLGLHFYRLEPANEYVLITQVGWPCLRQLWNLPEEELLSRWDSICESYKGSHVCPGDP